MMKTLSLELGYLQGKDQDDVLGSIQTQRNMGGELARLGIGDHDNYFFAYRNFPADSPLFGYKFSHPRGNTCCGRLATVFHIGAGSIII